VESNALHIEAENEEQRRDLANAANEAGQARWDELKNSAPPAPPDAPTEVQPVAPEEPPPPEAERGALALLGMKKASILRRYRGDWSVPGDAEYILQGRMKE